MAVAGPPAFHVLTKPIGPICNLDCKYCFYLEKEALYPGRTGKAGWAMADDVLETYVRQYIEAQRVPIVSFAWQGGEPTLLGVDYFRKVVALQRKYAGGKRIENALQTNGVLLDDRWGEFLAENRFLVGLSVDGPEEHHDRYRVDKGGRPTFNAAMRGLSVLKRHKVAFNTLTVVQRNNSRAPLPVYRFLRDAGSRHMQFIPVVERLPPPEATKGLTFAPPRAGSGAIVTDWSVEPSQYGAFLCTIFDEWVRNDVGRVFVQIFDVALEIWYGRTSSLCVFAETCGRALAVEHNGDLYSCDHYVYPENRLGNVLENPLAALVASPQQVAFGLDKKESLPEYCKRCEVRFACNGECPKHRFTSTPDGEPGLNYLCAGYKRFFTQVGPYMEFMAEELRNQRPPANVMAWARSRDRAGLRQPGPNEPCDCGSGKKHRKCCGRFAQP